MGTEAPPPSQWRLRLDRPKLRLECPAIDVQQNNGFEASAIPAFFEAYEVREKIGSGTTAVVRRANRVCDGKEVALKCIRTGDEEMQQFAKAEYELLRTLRHQSIIQAARLHESSMQVCIELEFCEKGCLQTYVEERGPLSEVASKPLFHQFLQAVDYLHKKRIVHRDLKPGNLLLTGSMNLDEQNKDVPSRLKITDFNSAKRVGDGLGATAMLTFRGTQLYYAPELVFGTGWNERVDIWCVGLCLFFAVRGELPFVCMSQITKEQLCQGRLPDISWQGISVLMQHIILQCLSVEMRDRPPAMELLRHNLFQENACQEMRVRSLSGDACQELLDLQPSAHVAASCPSKSVLDRTSVGSWPSSVPAEMVPSRCSDPLRQLQIKKLSRYVSPSPHDLVAQSEAYLQRDLPPTAMLPSLSDAYAHSYSPNLCSHGEPDEGGSSPSMLPENAFFTWSFPSRSPSSG